MDEYRKLTSQSSTYNKYSNKKVELDGYLFDSKGEAQRYTDLCFMKLAGEIKDLELQVRIPCVINGTKVFTYVADFVYQDTKTGEKVIEDFKGMRTPIFNLKKKILEAQGVKINITTK